MSTPFLTLPFDKLYSKERHAVRDADGSSFIRREPTPGRPSRVPHCCHKLFSSREEIQYFLLDPGGQTAQISLVIEYKTPIWRNYLQISRHNEFIDLLDESYENKWLCGDDH